MKNAETDSVIVEFKDGSRGPIPKTQWNAAKRLGAKVVMSELSATQRAVKAGADMLPTLGGFTGGIIGGGGGTAAAPGPGTVGGWMLGAGVGGGLGAAAQQGVYDFAGIPRDNSLGGSLKHIGLNAGWEGITGGLGGAGDLAVHGLRNPMMKLSLGNALPGVEADLVESRMAPSPRTLDLLKVAKEGAYTARRAAIDAAEQGGLVWKDGYQRLRGALTDAMGQETRGRVLDKEGRRVLANMLGVLDENLGPKTANITMPGVKAGQRATTQIVTSNIEAMTPSQLEAIHDTANEQLTKLFEANKGNRVTEVSAEEKGWLAVRQAAEDMLADVPEFAAKNADYARFKGMHDAVFSALKRSQTPASMATGRILGETAARMGGRGSRLGLARTGAAITGTARAFGVGSPADNTKVITE